MSFIQLIAQEIYENWNKNSQRKRWVNKYTTTHKCIGENNREVINVNQPRSSFK